MYFLNMMEIWILNCKVVSLVLFIIFFNFKYSVHNYLTLISLGFNTVFMYTYKRIHMHIVVYTHIHIKTCKTIHRHRNKYIFMLSYSHLYGTVQFCYYNFVNYNFTKCVGMLLRQLYRLIFTHKVYPRKYHLCLLLLQKVD